MKIQTLDQLWAVLPHEFKTHVCENDSELPTVTFEALKEEYQAAPKQMLNNYVPAYYGCGIIARALSIADAAGHEIGDTFSGIPRY